MKKVIVFVTVMCSIVIVSVSQAAFIGYDPQTNEWPDSSWTLTGGNGNDPIYQVANGIARIKTDSPDVGHYERSANFDKDIGYTVDWRINQLTSTTWQTGCQITIKEDNVGTVEIRLIKHENYGGLRLNMHWSGGETNVDGITADWHAFRFVRLGSNYKVYIDDVAIPIIDETAPTSDPDTTLIGFGDYGGASRFYADLDYILFDDTQAIFAPPIPEPVTISLLMAGMSIFCVRKRK